MKIKNIFFDFDGVIAESVGAKTEAFREIYSQYGEGISSQVVDYHINNGGVSRFEKFKYWEKKFFNKDISADRVNELAKIFSDLVLNKVIDSDEVPTTTVSWFAKSSLGVVLSLRNSGLNTIFKLNLVE